MGSTTQHIIYPQSGLDTDTSQEYIQRGDSPYRLHIMSSTDGTNGVVENMKGNHLASYQLSLSNCYNVLGSYYDRLTRKAYYLIFSMPYDWSGSDKYIYDNHLLCFDEDKETITNIFTDTKNYFGLNLLYAVKDWDMMGDYLYFNPRVSEPKMIDVVRAKNYTDNLEYDPLSTYELSETVRYFGGVFVANAAVGVGETPCTHASKWNRVGDSYQDASDINFDSELRYAFHVIKHIPVNRPICTYGTDEDKNSNSIRGKVFRFTHKYKYFDNTESLWSAYSDVTLPSYDETYNGEVTGSPDLNNYISIYISLHSAALVKEIEIAFQEIGGDWKRAKVINRQEQALLDDVAFNYKFYNTDAAYVVIDDNEFEEVYDSVPLKADGQELINKNILAYGGCTMGFTNIPKDEIDVTLTPELEAITVSTEQNTLRRNLVLLDVSQVWSETGWLTTIDMSWCPNPPPPTIQSTDVLSVRINGTEAEYSIQLANVASFNALMGAIETFLNTSYPTMGWVWVGNTFTASGYASVTDFSFWGTGATRSELTKKGGHKTGAWHTYCLFYYDKAMRRWDAQTSKENIDGAGYSMNGTTVYVPMFNEISPPPTDTANRWKMNWEVNHLPPDEAIWWRWGYAGGGVTYFVQYVISTIDNTTTPWTKMDIAPLQTIRTTSEAGWNQLPNSSIEPYEFVKGDRVRIITEAEAGNDLGAVYDGVLDFEIVKYEEDAGTYYIFTQSFDLTGLGAGTLIEIYRPRSTDTPTVYYEFGELMPIIEDSAGVRVHGCGTGGTQNQTTALNFPATGVFEQGDVYHILRTPSYAIDGTEGYFHESQWYSDFYISNEWSKGRPGIETTFGRRRLNIIQYSNQLLQNTKINGLSTFEARSYKDLNDIYGRLVGIVEVGNTLKAYMEKKCASILIGRQEYEDANGDLTTASSDRVLGSIRYSPTNFGCQFIESITKTNRYVYFYDAYNGVICRDTVNGIFPISGRYEEAGMPSDYKMETWFRDKSEALTKSGLDHVMVMTVFDERYKCLYVCFRDVVNSDNDDTIVFHEPSNRWITLAEFTQTPEEGYNVMLELDYWVVSGFELGIEFGFDEDTRFAIFDMVTGASDIAYPDFQEIDLTLYEPSVVVDCTVVVDVLSLTGFLPTPGIYLPYVDVTPNAYNWTAIDVIGTTFDVTCDPATCVLTAIPTWLWVDYNSNIGYHLNTGAVISTGAVLYIYPKEINTGAAITTGVESLVTFYESSTGMSDSITVTRSAPVSNPTVRVLAAGDDTNALNNVMNAGSVCYAGSTSVTIAFTCGHDLISDGTLFNVSLLIYISTTQTGVYGTVNNATLLGASILGTNTITIDNLNAVVQAGYWVWVYVYSPGSAAPPVTNATVSAVLNTITITPYSQFPKITYAKASVSSLAAFLYTESGLADKKTFTMNVGDSVSCVLYSYPQWATVTGGDGQGLTLPYPSSNPVAQRHAIENGETIFVYPTFDNSSQNPLTGTLVFVNEYGDTSSVTISQNAAPTYIPPSLTIHPYDYYLVLLNGQTTPASSNPYVVFGASLTVPEPNNVYLYAAFRNLLIDNTYDFFTVYWTATIARTGSTVYRGWFNTFSEYWLNGQNMAFPVGTNIVGTDTIVITFSVNYI